MCALAPPQLPGSMSDDYNMDADLEYERNLERAMADDGAGQVCVCVASGQWPVASGHWPLAIGQGPGVRAEHC